MNFVLPYYEEFFPDFKVGKIILEATFWGGKQIISSLKKKLILYSTKGFCPYAIVLPKVLEYYTSLKDRIFVL